MVEKQALPSESLKLVASQVESPKRPVRRKYGRQPLALLVEPTLIDSKVTYHTEGSPGATSRIFTLR